ncbi:MAG: MBL fold metallo-hydrolase [Pseudomonadota bacterium]
MEIKLTFLGAAQNVTGSCYLLEADDYKILIDCGLYQEREFKDRNFEPFFILPKEIDAIILTHAHLDHCGRIPLLVQKGFKGKIYSTSATLDIAKIVLVDSAKIQKEDARYKRKRHEKEGRKSPFPIVPLYTKEDVEKTLPLFNSVKYGLDNKISENLTIKYHEAGHILGSASVEIAINQNGDIKKILFSGDMGRWDKPILEDPEFACNADYIVCESTYGNRIHDKVDDIKEKLLEVITKTYEKNGNIIIPSFAIERSQELLYFLGELKNEKKIPNLSIFLDSPMAVSVTEVFKKHPEMFDEQMLEKIKQGKSPLDAHGLFMAKTTKQSKALNTLKGTSIIIAGSGMCTGGRIKHHLLNNISNPNNSILFVGYQASGTLGRIILDKPDEVRILGQIKKIRSSIYKISGFSAHADQNELLKWLSNISEKPKKLFITHGEPESSKAFEKAVRKNLSWDTYIPNYKDTFDLTY